MPPRKPDTVLSWAVARQLAVLAECDPRTIHAAARGDRGVGDSARRAREVVADYFDQNPHAKPAGWQRPPEAPLPLDVAKELAARAECNHRTIQRAAAGITIRANIEPRVREVIDEYFAAHPDERPSLVPGSTTEVSP